MRFLKLLPIMLIAIAVGVKYDFVFLPENMELQILEVKNGVVKEFSKDRLVIEKGTDTIIWENRRRLIKNGIPAGEYPVLQFKKCFEVFFPKDDFF